MSKFNHAASELNHNAVESVILHVKGTPGQQLQLMLGIPRRNKPHYSSKDESRPFKVPVKVPGNIQLHLSVDPQSKAGEGASAIVYDATVLSSSGVSSSAFPPLVVKVAHWMKQDLLSREAWNYNKMASLQGVCIPRCYGFFEIEAVPTCPLWGDSIDAEVIELIRINQGDISDPNESEAAKDYRHVDGRDDVLAILILEKLGDRIPKNPAPKGILKELAYIYNELAHLHILHGDVRYENILAAPDPELGFRGLARGGRVHKWRLIDFGVACETNQPVKVSQGSYIQDLTTLAWVFGQEVSSNDIAINDDLSPMV